MQNDTKAAGIAEMQALADLQYYRREHYELVVCDACHEWCERGEPCCGSSMCESACPICKELE